MTKNKNIVDKVDQALKGKKTYIVSIVTVIFALSGIITGNLEQLDALQMILGALGVAGLRDAI